MIKLQKIQALLVLGILFNTLHANNSISNLSSFNQNCIIETKTFLYNKPLSTDKSVLIRKKNHLHAIYSKKPTNSIIINNNELIKTTYGNTGTKNILSIHLLSISSFDIILEFTNFLSFESLSVQIEL